MHGAQPLIVRSVKNDTPSVHARATSRIKTIKTIIAVLRDIFPRVFDFIVFGSSVVLFNVKKKKFKDEMLISNLNVF